MDVFEAKALLERYLAGQATPEEITLVHAMYDRLVQEGEWQWKEGEKEALQAIMEDRLLQKIGDQTAPIRSMPRFSKYIRRLVAAAILIGISFGTYFLIKNQKATQPAVAVVQANPDVAPGGNRAILTLGNGSKILLDSAQNGIIAQQGNTNIVKTNSGKLAYRVSSDAFTSLAYNSMTTPRGGQYQLVLPDGTRVWLNSASSIIYPTAFVGKERKVEVTGEAYFEVVHDGKMPFRVKANDQIIEDVGTAFNINAYTDEKSLNTTLIEGSVRVIADQKPGNYSVVLKPAQQAQMAEGKITVKTNIDIDKVVAWKNGKMSLTHSSVQQIMREISRWYDVDIKYSGEMPVKKFYGLIDRNVPLSTVLLALKNYGVETKIEGKIIIVQ